MNIDTVYQTVQSQPHGGSGRGVSFWKETNECGRLVQLKVKHPPPQVGVSADEEDLNALRVGTFYHALHEAALAGQQVGQVWDMTDTMVQDQDWMEALRLYRAYVRDWSSPLTKWAATLVSVEEKLPKSEPVQQLVRDLFGDDVTFRADWVGDITDLAFVQQNTGAHLFEPGRYIFDHKTSKSRKAIHEWDYVFGNQCMTYLYLYNLEHPEAPAKGMIFDQIIKHVDISKEPLLTKTGTIKRESSYQAFVAQPNDDAEKIIRSLVERGMFNLQGEGRANPAHCFAGYKPCWFFQQGLCQRY